MEPALRLPFRLRGRDGLVTVAFGINEDPGAWGFERFDLPFDAGLVRGFPLIFAAVDYPGRGYEALMGWIQVVTVTERDPPRSWATTDVYPVHWGVDTPFVTFGHAPRLFDAPGPNPPRTDERWSAATFLAVCPDGARSRTVVPVVGFRWGYDLAAMHATPIPPSPAGEADWRRCRETLEREYPNWQFAPAPLDE